MGAEHTTGQCERGGTIAIPSGTEDDLSKQKRDLLLIEIENGNIALSSILAGSNKSDPAIIASKICS
jgi:hypothetical protein